MRVWPHTECLTGRGSPCLDLMGVDTGYNLMADMSQYSKKNSTDSKLRRHCEAIRRNKDIIGSIFIHLSEHPPNASAAEEAFNELGKEDQTDIYSVSTRDGGIWETWERDAVFYGRLDATQAWDSWNRRLLKEA